MNGLSRILWLTWLAVLLGPAAGAAEQGPGWQELSTAEQEVLKPFQSRWPQLSAERRLNLQKGSRRWAGMSAKEQRRVRQRFKHWRGLPPAERQRLRERYQRFRRLPAEEQKRVRRAQRRFQKMPLEHRRQLRKKWQAMSLDERRSFIRKRRGQGRAHVPGQQQNKAGHSGGRVAAPSKHERRPRR